MFDSALMQVAIVLGLLYTVLSLVCTALTEAGSSLLSFRARTLKTAIASLLDKNGKGGKDSIVPAFLDHPLILGLRRPRWFRGRKSSPEYIPSAYFARALLDVLPESKDDKVGTMMPKDLAELQGWIDAIPTEHVRRALRSVLTGATDLSKAIESIEAWYDHAMDRARGWYARRAQAATFAFALLLTLSMNADTLMIARLVWNDADLRAVLVAQAEALAERGGGPETAEERNGPVEDQGDDAGPAEGEEAPGAGAGGAAGTGEQTGGTPPPSSRGTQGLNAAALKKEVDEALTGFPLGWSQEQGWPTGNWDRASKLLGLLVTALAVSLGAPFWFDLLNRLVNLRSSGPPIPTARDKEKAVKPQAA